MIFVFTFTVAIKVEASEEPELTYDTETNTYGNGEYAITKYQVDMIVNEDNIYDITEYIEVYFSVPKHGIIREIPRRNELVRLDGSKSYNRAKISNIYVNNNYTMESNSHYKKIIIGEKDENVTVYENYEINYTYDIGNDKSEGFDELYFNLIGSEWDTTISNVEFSITMPKEFDESKLGFSSGAFSSTDSSSIIYNVEDKIINGKFIGVLEAKEGLTVRLELPEEYYNKRKEPGKTQMFILPILCLLSTFIIWLKYGKNDKVIETVEFYPPLDYSSAEIGFFYKGKVNDKDIISLLTYLSNKGYIKIIETESKKLFKNKKSFIFEKVKNYDGDNPYEKLFLSGLFKGSKNKVTVSELRHKFYVTSNAIKKSIKRPENLHKVFYEKSLKMKTVIILLAVISYLSIASGPFIASGDFEMMIMFIVFTGFAYIIIFRSLLLTENVIAKIIEVAFGMFILCIGLSFITTVYREDMAYLYAYLLGIACIIAMMIFMKFMSKRMPFGLEILGKIRGFKRFLKIAERPKLEALVMENPTYFYDILPYTYVLGVSDKWIKKFESITIEPPNWYHGGDDFAGYNFNASTFNSAMNTTMKTASRSMTSNPSSSSGGGSGGGLSGGGSGGGGGSSW